MFHNGGPQILGATLQELVGRSVGLSPVTCAPLSQIANYQTDGGDIHVPQHKILERKKQY
jgi:hypothetical protein